MRHRDRWIRCAGPGNCGCERARGFSGRGRTHERFDQFYRGVRVFGGDVAQQLNRGQVVSLFGNVYDDIDIDPSPDVDSAAARGAIETLTGVDIGRQPELVVLPREGGGYALAWRVRAMTGNDLREYFVDARSGSVVIRVQRSRETQSAVGRGTGVLGDSKKISATSSGGQFTTTDRLRPPAINTYDMKSDLTRTTRYLNNLIQLAASDLAADADNTWTDVAAVDAHVYAGWTYDYYFKRSAAAASTIATFRSSVSCTRCGGLGRLHAVRPTSPSSTPTRSTRATA